MREPGARERSREPLVHLLAAVIGPLAGVLLLGTFAPSLVLRTAALALAFTLVAAGLVRSVALGRSEWRRDRPSARAYAGVAGRFLVGFLLVVVATA